MDKAVIVCVKKDGEIVLPEAVRRRHNLDEDGAQVRIVEREDGVIELQPIPADQAWFWTPEWQEGERQVDEDIAAGRIWVANDIDEFIAHVDAVYKEAHPDYEPEAENQE